MAPNFSLPGRSPWVEAASSGGAAYNRKCAPPTRAVRMFLARRSVAPRLQGSSSGAISPSINALTSSSSSSSSSRNGSSGRLALLDVDLVDHRLGGLFLARLDFVERNQFDAGRRRGLFFLFFLLGGGALHARRRALEHRAAFRADDRFFVQIEKFRAAVLALALGSELGFGHGVVFPGVGRLRSEAPVSRRRRPCQCDSAGPVDSARRGC